MKSEKPKVLHELCGRPLLAYVIDALREAKVDRIVLVVGYRSDLVRAEFAGQPDLEIVEQTEQKGTGHAVKCAEPILKGLTGQTVVLAGDGPMVRAELIRDMLKRADETKSSCLLATASVSNPFGYGRIVRDVQGNFERIVEQKDATETERAITEINPSFYVFDTVKLLSALNQIKTNNAQGEYYLTDVPAIMKQAGERVAAEALATESDIFGINDRGHLAEAHVLMQARILQKHFTNGVTIVDARNTYIDSRATIGKDTVIMPFSVIHGEVSVGERCKIGPFAHIRPGTTLADDVTVGAFVEVNRSSINSETVVRHLAYLGDATLGSNVTVGAGFVTANFDGKQKQVSKVGDGARCSAVMRC